MTFIFKRPTRTQLFLKLHKHTKMANLAQFVKIVHPDDGSLMDRNMSGKVMITTQLSGSGG